MKRLLLASTIAASWASLGVAGTLPVSGVAPRASCAGLTGLTLPNAQILSATQKSGYCNVVGIINKRTSTQDPDHFTYGIGFALQPSKHLAWPFRDDGRRRHRRQPAR